MLSHRIKWLKTYPLSSMASTREARSARRPPSLRIEDRQDPKHSFLFSRISGGRRRTATILRSVGRDPFFHVSAIWLAVGVLVGILGGGRVDLKILLGKSASERIRFMKHEGWSIPEYSHRSLPLDVYPNVLGINPEMREEFHPIVMLPEDLGVADLTGSEFPVEADLIQPPKSHRALIPKNEQTEFMKARKKENSKIPIRIGRYDEDRRGMYSSDLFSKHADGEERSVHVGIDIGGPVGTKVHSFADGILAYAGYLEEHGDYGNVVIVQYTLTNQRTIWALYGHLDSPSTEGKKEGSPIKKGQVLGRFGDVHQNGGWADPHVHFALATNDPFEHDLPGVVRMKDRPRALCQYPDPRFVLGPIY